MQHSQQLYGSRLRAFQAEHGITDSRGTQPHHGDPSKVLGADGRPAATYVDLPPLDLSPIAEPPSFWRFLLGLGVTALVIASAAVWVMACWASQGLEAVAR